MNPAQTMLGIYQPGKSWAHKITIRWKYLMFLVLMMVCLLWSHPVVQIGMVVLSAVLVKTTGARPQLAWGVPWGLFILLAGMSVLYVVVGDGRSGVRISATILTALYGSRLILITTPMPVLVDAVVSLARPLRIVGINPERVGLAVAIMIRSIPYVLASFGEVRQAAQARGLHRNLMAQLTPVVIAAVAYARTTGQALQARGLGDDEPLN